MAEDKEINNEEASETKSEELEVELPVVCLLYTSPSPRDRG